MPRNIINVSKNGSKDNKIECLVIENYDENNYCQLMSKYYLPNEHLFAVCHLYILRVNPAAVFFSKKKIYY